VSDPFSFHSLNETGGNQTEPLRMPTSQCYVLETLDAQKTMNDSLDEALGAAFHASS